MRKTFKVSLFFSEDRKIFAAASPLKFTRPAGTEHLQCNRLFENDTFYIQQLAKHRLVYQDPAQLSMDCESIRRRAYFPGKAASKEEAEFGVARARIVYKVRVI
jgi:hypothetical protein